MKFVFLFLIFAPVFVVIFVAVPISAGVVAGDDVVVAVVDVGRTFYLKFSNYWNNKKKRGGNF